MKIIFYYLTIFVLININNIKTDLVTAKAIKNLILGPDYDSTIPPKDLTVIAVGNLFKQIVKLDQTSQFLTSSSTLVAIWNDSRLIWNSTKYQMNTISLKANQIWLPDLYVINSGESNGFLQVNDYSLATVTNDGFVIMAYPLNNLITSCPMNVYLFPYDLQTCSLIIGSWSQSYEQTYLVYVGDLSSNSFIENSIWSLQTTGASVKNTTRLSTKTTVYTSDIYFQATVKRKPLYYMINNVYPTIILNIITLFTYFFPFAQQSVLTLTILLTMAVISVRAAGDLPIISDYMPLIGLYFLLSMLYTFLSLIWFAACNSLRTNSSLPIFVNRLALKIKRVKQSVLMVFRIKVDMSMYQISKEKENNDLITILNNIAFFFMFMAMFVTYLTIWLIISN